MNIRIAAVALVGAAVCLDCPAEDFLYTSHVHRGGGKLERPDNTLETFKWCWENGSALECDCRRTKDGVGIMLHDKTLKRTGRGISAANGGRFPRTRRTTGVSGISHSSPSRQMRYVWS